MSAMPKFLITEACEAIMTAAGITLEELIHAGHHIHCVSIIGEHSRMTFASWPATDRLIFVDGIIKETRVIDGTRLVESLEPLLVLALTPDLPAGRVNRENDIEELLAFVAESFGVPARCHPESPFSTLYSGPCAGRNEMLRDRIHADHKYIFCGTFDEEAVWADRVYTFDVTKYLTWVQGGK